MSHTATEATAERRVVDARSPALARPRRELARRVSGGMEITLYWSAHDDSTSIEIWQPASGETLLFSVARERALDAFYHPFVQLPTVLDD
jgi:hypothetical protein